MVKRSLYREALLNKLSEQEDKFFENFSKDYLIYLGNSKPTKKQITEMISILSHVWLKRRVCLDLRLTEREKQCLYLSALGKSIKEIARYFKVTVRQVELYRQAIFKKLFCKNIGEAIAKGLRYGEISMI
jgi:DNA-binding CsgD family transcriptional regulator